MKEQMGSIGEGYKARRTEQGSDASCPNNPPTPATHKKYKPRLEMQIIERDLSE